MKISFQFFTNKNLKKTEKIVAISHGNDTFPLNQSRLVVRTETFEKGTDTIFIHSVQGLKDIFPHSLNIPTYNIGNKYCTLSYSQESHSSFVKL